MEAPGLLDFLRRWGLGIGVLIICGVAYPLPAKDYEISAHAALTTAIIDVYNAAYPDNEIDDIYRFDLLRGAKEEDDGIRFFNHFYDPVKNRGLSFGGQSWMRSKSWAVADNENEFSWNAGLEAYARGDYHRAFLVLGHALHLLEDTAVPDHVRNDAHAFDSPYESFTNTLAPHQPAGPPLIFKTVGEYFDALALYVNEGFYSADTIEGSIYKNPVPDYVKREGKYVYGFKKNKDGNFYHLINKNNKSLFDGAENKILSDYWRLLSAAAVQYGAGMTHFFIAEGERMKHERAVLEKKRSGDSSALASVIGIFGSFAAEVGVGGDGFTEAETISLDGDSNTGSAVAASAPKAEKSQSSAKASSAAMPTASASKKASAKTPPPAACVWAKTVMPTNGPVIINEVAWMGSKNSASDEWIELKNISGESAMVSGWQVISKRGNISAVLPVGAVIPPGGFYLLERTDDGAVPGIAADFVYIGSLANSDDGVRLLDAQCAAADEAFGSPAWPAGHAVNRLTMERARDLSWHDYTGSGVGGLYGTPRAENSAPPAVKPLSAASAPSSVSGGGNSVSKAAAPAAQAAPAVQTILSASSAPSYERGDIVINEFLFDAVGTDAGNEFIELYNPTDSAINLSGWSLQIKSGVAGSIKKKNFDDGLSIPANGCFLAWLGTPPPDARPQFIWSSGTLNNTAATIYISAGTDEVGSDNDSSVIDVVSYIADQIPGFAPGMSVERAGETQNVRAREAPSPGSCVRLAADAPVPNGGINSSFSSGAPRASFPIPAITFVKNPAGAGSRIDISWNEYPFIPPTDKSTWSGIIFYLNRAPDGGQYLVTDNRLASGSDAALVLQYPNIRTGSFPYENILILPDVLGRMTTDNGLAGGSYNFYKLSEDNGAYATTPTQGKAGDYITAGYYRFWGSGGGSQTMELIYADPKKIYFK